MSGGSGVRLVVLSPVTPEETPEHAGGVLLSHVVAALRPDVHLTVVVPEGPAVRRAVPHPRIDELIVVPVPAPSAGRAGGLRARAAEVLAPGRAPAWFVAGLADSEPARRAVALADVVDLQWQEQAVLVPWVRTCAPGARVTVLLHDVLSQAAERSGRAVAGASGRRLATRARWAWARTRARATERRLRGADPGPDTPDAVGVLSEKDADLLPPGAVPVTVLPPPLGGTHAGVRRGPGSGGRGLLMVAYLARWTNEDGFRWFVTEVLPTLRSVHPGLDVRVAGTGIRPHVAELARTHGVELLGFVPDLTRLYEEADAVVVPLRQGAGVKFKTVEALSAGVPVVTTPVGAEGVGPDHWFAGLTEDPHAFAAALLHVLDGPAVAGERADRARREVAAAYSETAFRAGLARYYGHGVVDDGSVRVSAAGTGTDRHEETPGAAPEVTVVIPAFNAAATIGAQLESLARQVAAPPFEVVVADNRSTDGTAEVALAWAGAFPCGLRVVGAHERQGVSHARNRGCHAARAECILICDADDRVQENWVAEMSRALQTAEVVASDAIPVVDSVERPAQRESGRQTGFGGVPYLLCGALGIRREAWASVGGFDESFPAGHEDVDFCRRLTRQGYSLDAVPSTAIRYTQRADPAGRRRQAFHYARGSMLLWTRLVEDGVHHPVSFTGSVRRAVRLSLRAAVPGVRDDDGRRAHELGWAWGVVAGHVRYRVLGRPPRPRLWEDPR